MIALGLVLAVGGLWAVFGRAKARDASFKEAVPFYGSIERSITSTGIVQPQNRLEVKPPIGGRIDKILVEEGQGVKVGDVLALMSSTDRATLLDAARLRGGDTFKNWEEIYKPTPLLAPIDGQVIVKAADPGQIVTPSDPVIVLSDRLIVQAQVDETDIGKVKAGQAARITLDAYPQLTVQAGVNHVSYESTVVNNVTIYKVDILPDRVPAEFRAGMSANVEIVQEIRDNVLLVPLEAVKRQKDRSFVFLSQGPGQRPVRQEVQTGLSDEKNIEIVSGLAVDDAILAQADKLELPKSRKTGTNPFMPPPRGGGRGGR
jgi:macrolide-specific efflux system membrane fusion protein